MLPPFVINGATARARATSEYALTSCATRNASRVVLTKIAFERFLRRERDRMQQKIDPISLASHFLEKRLDLGIVRNVAWKQRRLFPELADQFLDVLFQPFALIIEDQACPGIRPGFRDRPRDAALVRHAENNTGFAR